MLVVADKNRLPQLHCFAVEGNIEDRRVNDSFYACEE